MEYVKVQGERIPAIGLGTWQLKEDTCEKAVEEAINAGYRHIDTAQAYGNERQVGNGIESSGVDRDEIWLTTKIWRTNFRHNDVKDSFQESLEKLQTDYVDLLLIHWPSKQVEFRETLDAMAELVEEGKVENIGISNFTASQIEEAWEASERPIITDQVEYHPFLQQKSILEKCREKDMMLTAYSPLARGSVLGNTVLREIGESYGKSEAQVALRWLIQHENISTVPKATSKAHIEQNIDIFDFELGREEMRRINELDAGRRKVDPDFSPEW